MTAPVKQRPGALAALVSCSARRRLTQAIVLLAGDVGAGGVLRCVQPLALLPRDDPIGLGPVLGAVDVRLLPLEPQFLAPGQLAAGRALVESGGGGRSGGGGLGVCDGRGDGEAQRCQCRL